MIVNPKPVQRPLPPFYMASSSLDGVELAGKLGINLFLPIHTRTPEQVIEFADGYWDSLRTHGHQTNRTSWVSSSRCIWPQPLRRRKRGRKPES